MIPTPGPTRQVVLRPTHEVVRRQHARLSLKQPDRAWSDLGDPVHERVEQHEHGGGEQATDEGELSSPMMAFWTTLLSSSTTTKSKEVIWVIIRLPARRMRMPNE